MAVPWLYVSPLLSHSLSTDATNALASNGLRKKSRAPASIAERRFVVSSCAVTKMIGTPFSVSPAPSASLAELVEEAHGLWFPAGGPLLTTTTERAFGHRRGKIAVLSE